MQALQPGGHALSISERRLRSSVETDPLEETLASLSGPAAPGSRPETVLLVVPPSPQIPTPGREFLVTGPFEGFTAVATLVKKLGFRLKVLDCRGLEGDMASLVVREAQGVSAAGFAAYGDSFVFLRDSVKALKAARPELPVFLGGPLVSALPEIVLREAPADCAVLGEAELTLIELLGAWFDLRTRDISAVKGLAYFKGGRFFSTGHRPQIANLDRLPFPDYTVWPAYRKIADSGQIIISSSRGCPCGCSFCFKPIEALRVKSLDHFEREVAFLRETTGFSYTWLNDLTFNADPARALRVAEILAKYGVRYHCFSRVNGVTPEFAAKLAATGCQGIWFGVESLYDKALLLARKNTDLAAIKNALEVSAKAGINPRGLFIVGLPGETEESLKSMLDFIEKGDFIPLVKYLVPFPGTAIYDQAVASGKIKDPVKFLEWMSARKVGDYDDEIINMTDLDEKVLRNYFRRIWEITRARDKQGEER